MSDERAGEATHEEICDSALRHYENISAECNDWMNTVPKAISFYKVYGKFQPPKPVDVEGIEEVLYEHIGGQNRFFKSTGEFSFEVKRNPVDFVNEIAQALAPKLSGVDISEILAVYEKYEGTANSFEDWQFSFDHWNAIKTVAERYKK